MPRALQHYRCERTLMCCREPFVATVSEDEEARMRQVLAETEEGRALLPDIDGTLEGEGGERQFVKPFGQCLHLDEKERGCRIHAVAGIRSLPATCRNFPRHVQSVGGERWDVQFSLSCPTAARLLSEDPRPYMMMSEPGEAYPFKAVRSRVEDPEREALLAAWMAVLHDAHEDARRLVHTLAAMLATPLAPSADGPASDDLSRGFHPLVAAFAFQRLAGLPNRAAVYMPHGAAVNTELRSPWTLERLIAAADAAPELLAVLVEHELYNVVMHPESPAPAIVRLAARRGLLALRVVDALCDRVPLRTKHLFADAYTVVGMQGIEDHAPT